MGWLRLTVHLTAGRRKLGWAGLAARGVWRRLSAVGSADPRGGLPAPCSDSGSNCFWRQILELVFFRSLFSREHRVARILQQALSGCSKRIPDPA